MTAPGDVFTYLSVLVSIVIGLGMAQILAATVRIIHHRRTTPVYGPTIIWAIDLFVLFALVWWSEFSLTRHTTWTFGSFLTTLAIPSLMYVAASLLLPGSDTAAALPMRAAYEANRRPFFVLLTAAIVSTFVQTYLLEGHINLDIDAYLKGGIMLVSLVAVFVRTEIVQRSVAAINLAWVAFYVALLFVNLRTR